MLVLLIVIPAMAIAVTVVVVLDRVGVLAPFDGGHSDRQGGLLENIPKGALLRAGR